MRGISLEKTRWRFAADRGGTFTDIVGIDPAGHYHTLKLLSVSPQYRDASIEGIRRLLELDSGASLPEEKIGGIRFGTTVATNALLERKGGRVALFITKGFRDLLEIGEQNRPDIFRLCIKKSLPFYSAVFEVDERMDCRGEKIKGIDLQGLEENLDALKEKGFEAAAVVFMHSWINPLHELLFEEALRQKGIMRIFLSHRTVNLIKIVGRGQSTLIDAYLSSVMAQYLDGIKKSTGTIPVEFMQSSGVLCPAESFAGRNALLSGPAGGLAAVARIAAETGIKCAIGFDMGGTSTDVSRYEGALERIYEKTIGDIPLQTEMLDIVTVAAGGGSILRFDGQKMTAGPESAGSLPGPACYGFGGPLTVTDANLLTGRIIPEYFPKTFGPDRNAPLDVNILKEKFDLLTAQINAALSASFSSQETAEGFLRVANEKMAMAIKEISVSRGFDVRDYSLVCFGGAGGQHACSIASLLGMRRIVIHPLSSLMSAYGIGLSRPAWRKTKTVLMPYGRQSIGGLTRMFEEMEEELLKDITARRDRVDIRREIDLRPMGAETFLTLEFGDFEQTLEMFEERYGRLFGFRPEKRKLEAANLRIEMGYSDEFFPPYAGRKDGPILSPSSRHLLRHEGRDLDAPVYPGNSLFPGTRIAGPAFIIDPNFTVVVDPGFEAGTDESGIIFMTRIAAGKRSHSAASDRPDPVLLEVFNNLFTGIATEMGITLKNTAHSINMKERLDFSCALFDPLGNLVANAPHIPVHLGSMADTVKAVLKDKGDEMKKGDIYLTNNPYRGGSHLPDMTVVCPVYSDKGDLIFFTAARGHHSDVGGKTPGSMPPTASHIGEEGIVIDSLPIVRAGTFMEESLRRIFLDHKFPVRNIGERIFDLEAQIAASHKGARELLGAVERYGLKTVMSYMRFIRENAAYSVKKALRRFLRGGVFTSAFEDFLDDGTPVRAAISIEGGPGPEDPLSLKIDFTGTGRQHLDDNLNAPSSVTSSAVMYVLRSLMEEDIPLNSGCLEPVEIFIPPGTILNPSYPAPVASGNVETSQRIVDVLLGAFGIAAASQGTMNNLLFEVGGEAPYYETIAGGSGALKGCPGASGVQVHMTNTRITDPEILEFRHPGVMLEQFKLRKGSGGRGLFKGGDGVVREIRFLRPATVSILSERRVTAPYGMEGGEAGQKGLNLLRKSCGDIEVLRNREVLKLEEGDSIVIETPGGGGYGTPAE
jgi:5-oxoprolinase (ATP-hydrolysing)